MLCIVVTIFCYNKGVEYKSDKEITENDCLKETDDFFQTHRERYDAAMVVTDVKIRKVFLEGPMKAIVSVTFDHQLAVHDVKVIYARERHFIVMPSKKNPDGTYRDIVHPINSAFRAEL